MNRKTNSGYRYFDLIMVLFVTVLIVSNIASSAKIIDLGFKIGETPMAFDAGTLLFPISYIFGDVLTEVYGFRNSRRVIWSGFACLAFASLVFGLVRILPGEAAWQGYAGQPAYDSILGGMSSGGIVLASLAAYLAGEFSNSVVLARLKVATQGKWLWLRTIGSTLIGEGVDSVIFIFIATLFGVFPWELFWALTMTNYMLKVFIEVVMTPLTYVIVGWLKRSENEDVYESNLRIPLVG